MEIGIVGGGINGLCCALLSAKKGHKVYLYERDTLMSATSANSSKLLHGGLRYLENKEFGLVRQSLCERDAWIKRAPNIAKPLRIVIPIYKNARRKSWMIAIGMYLYDHMTGASILPKAKKLTAQDIYKRDGFVNKTGLLGGYEFSDAQMDDYALGHWVARQAVAHGVSIFEHTEIKTIDTNGHIMTVDGKTIAHDMILNVAGPWAEQLLTRSGVSTPYKLDLVRGSHLVLVRPCTQAYLLEIPGERRIFFVLPWKGKTLIGTTEKRQTLDNPVKCSSEEREYLLNAFSYYFPNSRPNVEESFAGLRPLLLSAKDPNKATREYAIYRTRKVVTVLGGKWTTAMALAEKVTKEYEYL